MLLNYYDNFINSEIVKEKYEAVSYPSYSKDGIGVYTDSPGSTVNFYGLDANRQPNVDSVNDKKDYINNLKMTKDKYLHSKLVSIALQDDNERYNLASTYEEISSVVDKYLEDILPKSFYHINGRREYGMNLEKYVSIYEEALNQLKQDKPVILFSMDLGGHAMVAFHYDEKNDYVYCHNGYHDYKRILRLKTSELKENIFAYMNIDFDINICPNKNYVGFTDDSIVKYKYDYYDINVIHFHSPKTCVSDGNKGHLCYCRCGFLNVKIMSLMKLYCI